jgi:hypothetical protein
MVVNKALSEFLRNLSGSQFFNLLLSSLISLGFVVGALYFTFNLLFGVIQWIASGGNSTQIESAKRRITNGSIGLVVLLSFFAIVDLAGCFFGVDLLRISIGRYSISFAQKTGCF